MWLLKAKIITSPGEVLTTCGWDTCGNYNRETEHLPGAVLTSGSEHCTASSATTEWVLVKKIREARENKFSLHNSILT